MYPAELSAWGVRQKTEYLCVMETKETTDDFFICEIQTTPEATFQELKVVSLTQCSSRY